MSGKRVANCGHDLVPCVLVDGDYCYSLNMDDEPACRGCGRTVEQTGVPKPKGFDKMLSLFKCEKTEQ